MILRVPKQSVIYRPTFWQVLKFAWTKYFAVLIFVYFLLERGFLNYVMTSGYIFDTVEISEVGKQYKMAKI